MDTCISAIAVSIMAISPSRKVTSACADCRAMSTATWCLVTYTCRLTFSLASSISPKHFAYKAGILADSRGGWKGMNHPYLTSPSSIYQCNLVILFRSFIHSGIPSDWPVDAQHRPELALAELRYEGAEATVVAERPLPYMSACARHRRPRDRLGLLRLLAGV